MLSLEPHAQVACEHLEWFLSCYLWQHRIVLSIIHLHDWWLLLLDPTRWRFLVLESLLAYTMLLLLLTNQEKPLSDPFHRIFVDALQVEWDLLRVQWSQVLLYERHPHLQQERESAQCPHLLPQEDASHTQDQYAPLLLLWSLNCLLDRLQRPVNEGWEYGFLADQVLFWKPFFPAVNYPLQPKDKQHEEEHL